MPYLPDSPNLGLLDSYTSTTHSLPTTKASSMMDEEVRKLTSFPALEARKEDAQVTCVESVTLATPKVELTGGDVMDGVEYASRPPSPPESGTVTPRLRRAQCPHRLRPLMPPPNFGAVKSGALFRSAFPQDRNVDFLKSLELRTVLCLVDTEPSEAYRQWIRGGRIDRRRVDILPNKDGKVSTTWDSLCEALLLVMDASHYPMYIHCNQGRHRTGCLIACLRKVQRWSMDDIIMEYKSYADPKARPGDIELIQAFDPEAVFAYAKAHGFFDNNSSMRRMDSAVANVDALAEALSSNAQCAAECELVEIGLSESSGSSVCSDDHIEMRASPPQPVDPPLQKDSRPSRPGLRRANSSLNGIVPRMSGVSTDDPDAADEEAMEVGNHVLTLDTSHAHEPATTTTVIELLEDAVTPPAV